MGREYEWLFGALPQNSAPAYLCERVFGAMTRERIRILRMRLVFSSCTGVLSLGGFIVAGKALVAAMSASGFLTYASLALTDSSAVLGSSHSFLLSLLESLPGPEVVFSLALLAVFIQSLRVLVVSGIAWAWRTERFA
ncbi:MAG TPA: hypothetical protein VHC20_02000 [Candidatus Paceibacterota bacterium]|nr:hypothetical protein [Candidatus Paceibacterota bacterium]